MTSINPIQTPASSKLALATKSHQQNQQPTTDRPAAEFKTHSGLHTFRRAWQQQKNGPHRVVSPSSSPSSPRTDIELKSGNWIMLHGSPPVWPPPDPSVVGRRGFPWFPVCVCVWGAFWFGQYWLKEFISLRAWRARVRHGVKYLVFFYIFFFLLLL